ncbi:uncharacterized protein [Nicotiana sylvestris]|uniref:uncharacterized protein n=1 Tax=Nicotiana sylvestris TaxID=4096 RepID=UPI00388C98A8
MAVSANKRLGYLERGLVELERKFLKRIEDGQNAEGNEGGHLARAYLLLGLYELVKLFDGAKHVESGEWDPRVHLRTYCDKLVGVRKDKRICMKLFLRSLKGDALSWYISQDPKKWLNWVSMVSEFMDRFRFNTENAPDVFYIQNLKKKPTETFREYATHWRSEAAKVRPALEEEQMNKFFVRAQDPQYYERLRLIESLKFFDIIKVGERIEEGIKNGMVTNFEDLQATNKSLQSGGTSNKRDVGTGHTIDECRSLKDKVQTLIDNKIIVAKEPTLNVRNNPLSDHKGGGVHMIEIEDDWDPKGSIG